MSTIPHITEIRISQYRTIGSTSLFDNLFTMHHKKEISLCMLLFETLIVESGNNRFTGTGGSNYQVSPVVMVTAFLLQPVKDVVLIFFGLHQIEHRIIYSFRSLSVLIERLLQALAIPIQIESFEYILFPIGIKCILYGSENMRQFHLSYLHIPLQAFGQCCMRNIGRANICRMEAAIAHKHIRLGVKAV